MRDAGTIEFAGRAFDGLARGRYSFVPDARFQAELERRGYGRGWDDQHFQLAMHDIGLAYVDELRRQGYDRPGIDGLVRMGQHGVSLAYFSRLFKDEVGMTFSDYLTHIRIEKAKDLLGRGDLRPSEIGALVGYEDPKYFSQIFRRAAGLSPQDYQRSLLRGRGD